MKTLIFHGPSGSGKDTQVDILAQKVKFERIGASLAMTKLKEEGNALALEAEKYGREGKLYPDEIVYGMLEEWLKRIDPELPWLFVSPVRKATQIALFDALVAKFNRKLEQFVHFTLTEEAAIERMSLRTSCPTCQTTYHKIYKQEKVSGKCDNDGAQLVQREDDQPEAIKRRLSWYNDDINPILDEYKSRGILLEIDASPSIEQIHEELIQKLKI